MLIQLRIQGDVKLINLRNYVSIYYSYWLCGRIINVLPYLQKNETFFTLYCDQLNTIETLFIKCLFTYEKVDERIKNGAISAK